MPCCVVSCLIVSCCVVSHRIVLCRVSSYRVVSCLIVSCCVVSRRTVLCRVSSYRVVSCLIVSCCVVSHRIVLCRVSSYRVVSCLIVSCCVVSHRIVLCRVSSYRVVSCLIVSCCVVSHRIVLCRVSSYRVVSCLIVSCCVVSHRIVLCRVSSYRVVSCLIVSCCVVSHRIVLCRVSSYRVVSCRAMSCDAMPCHVVLCRVVSCRVALHHVVASGREVPQASPKLRPLAHSSGQGLGQRGRSGAKAKAPSAAEVVAEVMRGLLQQSFSSTLCSCQNIGCKPKCQHSHALAPHTPPLSYLPVLWMVLNAPYGSNRILGRQFFMSFHWESDGFLPMRPCSLCQDSILVPILRLGCWALRLNQMRIPPEKIITTMNSVLVHFLCALWRSWFPLVYNMRFSNKYARIFPAAHCCPFGKKCLLRDLWDAAQNLPKQRRMQ